MEGLLSVLVGLGLAAACGFRVFVPLLVMSLAARTGDLVLAPGFEWLASDLALSALAVATALEVGAYYVPLLDNLLDAAAMPAAVIAGILATASSISGMHPFLAWAIAIIGGGGVAGTVQTVSTLVRGGSTLMTGGLGNPVVSTGEAAGAVLFAILAIALPILAILLLAGVVVFTVKKIRQRRVATST